MRGGDGWGEQALSFRGRVGTGRRLRVAEQAAEDGVWDGKEGAVERRERAEVGVPGVRGRMSRGCAGEEEVSREGEIGGVGRGESNRWGDLLRKKIGD